ncbi:MAG: hypothetical protein QOI41_7010, partial [Myxococcales bacterium]|nr:hypothetical protein [Myxococcales bacterium]
RRRRRLRGRARSASAAAIVVAAAGIARVFAASFAARFAAALILGRARLRLRGVTAREDAPEGVERACHVVVGRRLAERGTDAGRRVERAEHRLQHR